MIGIKIVVKIAIVVVVTVLVLALSCPDEESFNRWAKGALVDEDGSALERARGKALATQADWTADYQDYVLWSMVEAYQGGDRHRYLGVLWMWLDLGEA